MSVCHAGSPPAATFFAPLHFVEARLAHQHFTVLNLMELFSLSWHRALQRGRRRRRRSVRSNGAARSMAHSPKLREFPSTTSFMTMLWTGNQ
jgi:hypothetical protein